MLDSMDKLIAGLADSTKLRFYKPTVSNTAVGQWHSLWTVNGFPTAGGIPTAPAVCTHQTLGSWPLPTAGLDKKLYIAKLSASGSVAVQLLVCDRLAAMGGLSGTNTGVQAVNLDVATPAAAGRCGAGGERVIWSLEWYVQTGATPSTATVTYTNEHDETGRTTTVALAATRRVTTMLPIYPAYPDQQIKSIQSVQLSPSTATAGNFGVTAITKLADVLLPVIGVGAIMDFAALSLPDLVGSECLSLVALTTSTTSGNILGSMEIINA